MISILIASFNNNRFLIDSIESVYNQEPFDDELELIVCDDCSNDGSIEILEKLQSKYHFIILKNDNNLGVGATKRKLVNASRGNWFIFLDSDDKLAPNCLNRLWSHLNKLNIANVSMLYANSFRLEENGTIVKWSRSKGFQNSLLEKKFDYPIFHPVIYNRHKYNFTEGIDINLKAADDFDLWYKMEEVGQIVFLDEALYYYRINPNGVSQVVNNTTKWVQVMMEHAYCSASAAKRRGLDVRIELNDFSEVLINKLGSNKSKALDIRRISKKTRKFLIKKYENIINRYIWLHRKCGI